jgi:hypothetical protein
MDRTSLDSRYIGLPTAATLVHISLFLRAPDALSPALMRTALEGIARVLAPFVRIYTMPDPSKPVEIPAAELASGTFTEGAHAFQSQTGYEYRHLVVQRSDVNAAIPLLRHEVLKRALAVAGSVQYLSELLALEPADLEAYLAGRKMLPPEVFRAVIHIVAGKRLHH